MNYLSSSRTVHFTRHEATAAAAVRTVLIPVSAVCDESLLAMKILVGRSKNSLLTHFELHDQRTGGLPSEYICVVLLSAFFHMTISGEFVLDAARRGVP